MTRCNANALLKEIDYATKLITQRNLLQQFTAAISTVIQNAACHGKQFHATNVSHQLKHKTIDCRTEPI